MGFDYCSKRFAPVEMLEELAVLLPTVDSWVEDAYKWGERGPILLMGSTGAGKSTLANYLNGRSMHSVDLPGFLCSCVDCDNPVTEIGHGHKSKTQFPVAVNALDGTLLCDCPGFFDTNGAVADIRNMYAIAKLAKSAGNVAGIVLVLDYHSLSSDRKASLTAAHSMLGKLLPTLSAKTAESLLVVVSKWPSNRTTEDLRIYLSSSDIGDAIGKVLLPAFARAVCYDPLESTDAFDNGFLSRHELIGHMSSLRSLRSNEFKPSICAKSEAEVMSALNDRTLAHLSALSSRVSVQQLTAIQVTLAHMSQLKILRLPVMEEKAAQLRDAANKAVSGLAIQSSNLTLLRQVRALSFVTVSADRAIQKIEQALQEEREHELLMQRKREEEERLRREAEEARRRRQREEEAERLRQEERRREEQRLREENERLRAEREERVRRQRMHCGQQVLVPTSLGMLPVWTCCGQILGSPYCQQGGGAHIILGHPGFGHPGFGHPGFGGGFFF